MAQERGSDGGQTQDSHGGLQGPGRSGRPQERPHRQRAGGAVRGAPTLIHDWKKRLLAGAEAVFAHGVQADGNDTEAQKAQFYEQIGRLKMELERVKKSCRLRLTTNDR